MDVKPYINPFEEGSGDKVEEPVAVSTSSAHQLDALRHQVIDAVASSDDKVTLVLCLDMLTHQRKHRRIRCAGKSDVFLWNKSCRFIRIYYLCPLKHRNILIRNNQ